MTRVWQRAVVRPGAAGIVVLSVLIVGSFSTANAQDFSKKKLAEAPALRAELKLAAVPFKIVYESYRGDSWDLVMVDADGSNPLNLTRTSNVDEMYPHVSPDGTKISFVADEKTGEKKVRNVYYMNLDGSGQTKVADNARQQCWSPDAKSIAYLKAEFDRYTTRDYATKELMIYNLKTGKHKQHTNNKLHHLYNICLSPAGDWFLATVHGGMGYRHAQLAFEAHGTKVFDLTKWGVGGCRPDISPDGKKVAWGKSDEVLCVGDLDFAGAVPRVTNVRDVATCPKGYEVYHADWSPDGRYIAFSHGPKGEEMVAGRAKGWNICVGDLTGKWTTITDDGKDNKEPDWVPVSREGKSE